MPYAEVRRWFGETRPDVVHVHHPFPLSATAVLTARRLGIPVAATNHTIPECSLWGIRNFEPVYGFMHAAFARWLVFLLNRCDAVAVPTDTAARALQSLGFRKDVTTISNGVDTKRFSPAPPNAELRQRLGLDERPIILYTGRLDAEKQMDVWIRAAAQTVKATRAQFLVGGQGSDRPKLEDMVRDLELGTHVKFCGYVDDDEFPAIYNLASAYCITSPVELQSISTLEAVASGLPVVGVRAGALPELIHDGKNGILVPPGSSDVCSSALVTILESKKLQLEMGQRSREVAIGHSLEKSVSLYERFLDSTAHTERGVYCRERPVIA
ncbi:MAG: glycosyltransferase family 4 protein [Chloroflexota bacterium]